MRDKHNKIARNEVLVFVIADFSGICLISHLISRNKKPDLHNSPDVILLRKAFLTLGLEHHLLHTRERWDLVFDEITIWEGVAYLPLENKLNEGAKFHLKRRLGINNSEFEEIINRRMSSLEKSW